MGKVILVEIAVTSPAGAASTLRFSDRPIRPLPPTDVDRANVKFDSRIVESPAFRRALFDSLDTMLPALGVGTLTLSNGDKVLDPYEGYTWGQLSAYLWTEGTAFSAATVLMKGLCQPPSYPKADGQPGRVTVGLTDFAAEASKPLQTTVLAGTNGVGGVLYEGAPDGVKGRPKPVAIGNLLDAHVPAPKVNAGVGAYQLHDGAIQGSEQIFDRGDNAGFADNGDFVGAAFDGGAPGAAQYRTDVGRGLLKINGNPVGKVAFGFKADNPAGSYVETPGPVLARLLAKAGVPGGRVGASVAGLVSASVVGVFATDPISLGDAIRPVASSVPAAVIPDRSGVWQALPYGPPTAIADFALNQYQIIDCKPDDSAPLPVGEVRVGWGRIWTTYTGAELAAALAGTTSQERLAAEYRWAVATDATTKARFPNNWRSIEILTALREEAPAVALATALKTLLAVRADGKPRRMWRVTVELETALARQLGQTAALDYPPKGISGNFLVVGEELLRPRRTQAILSVWG